MPSYVKLPTSDGHCPECGGELVLSEREFSFFFWECFDQDECGWDQPAMMVTISVEPVDPVDDLDPVYNGYKEKF